MLDLAEEEIHFGEDDYMAMAVSKDGMIVKKWMRLSIRKGEKNRFIGIVLPENQCVLERLFDDYVRDITKKDQSTGNAVFEQSVEDAFVENH